MEELGLVALTEVPVEAERGDREVRPAVADRQVAEVDVAGPRAVVGDEGVRGAGVAVDEDRVVDRWAGTERGRPAPDPDLRRPLAGEVVDRNGVDRPQPGGDRPDRLRPPSPPLVADGRAAGERLGEQPLSVAVTLYVPEAAVVSVATVGFCSLEVNPFGPLQA